MDSMNKLEQLQTELKETIQLQDIAKHPGTKSLLRRKIYFLVKQIDRISL